jgi:acyl carrier protein
MPAEIADDRDLIADGLLDSVGFIELLLFVERETGYKVDLSDIDPSQFTTLRGLCAVVMGNGR